MHPTLQRFNKVPAITATFRVIKILSTTIGGTFADYLSVNVGLGPLVTDGVVLATLTLALIAQFQPSLLRRHRRAGATPAAASSAASTAPSESAPHSSAGAGPDTTAGAGVTRPAAAQTRGPVSKPGDLSSFNAIVDDGIDRALTALRADHPTTADSLAALHALPSILNTLQGLPA